MNRFTLEILRLANNGCGVGVSPDGKTAFVSGAVPGDLLQAETVSEHNRFRNCRIETILRPSADRIPSDCSAAEECGGCCFRQINYHTELQAKESFVRDAFARVGDAEITPEPLIPSPVLSAYRNKVEFAAAGSAAGFYSEKTHRIISAEDCPVVPPEFIRIRDRVSGMGLPLHHLVLRRSGLTGEIMLIMVSDRPSLENERGITESLRKEFPAVQTIILNTNRAGSGQVLGTRNRVLCGSGTIRDRISSVPVEIGPLSFFQVNTPAAEELYRVAAEYADLRPDDVLLDLYCGMGTIGLSMADRCRQLYGCEIIPEAVRSAERNAAEMGLSHTRFFCGDAGEIALRLEEDRLHPNVVILDPPRRGCSPQTLASVGRMGPDRIVMVSCDPVTAARDVKLLRDSGYVMTRIRPVDLFPRTRHVETVCLLVLRNPVTHINIDVDVEELVQDKRGQATYEQIRDYVKEQTGLNVTNLNIAQTKRKCGIIERENYNLPKSEDSKQPNCTKEKEDAIKEAFKHFGMI